MSERGLIVSEAVAAMKPQLLELRDAQRAVSALRDKIANQFSEAVKKIPEFPDDMDEDEMDDQLDELRDLISDVAYDLGLTWDDYGWSPGEAVEMWEASTC